MQGGTCGTENCDGRGLMYSAWPIRVGWVAGSGWMPIWLTNADQLRSAHAEPGSQSNQPQRSRVTCGSSVKSVFWIWSLRPGCSKVSWDLWKGTIASHRKLCMWFLIHAFILVNTLRPRQDGRHFPDDIFKWIFLNENVWISLRISLKFVPKVWINNIPALVQIMAWHRPSDKPLSEPMKVSLLTHICVTRPQWVNIC